MMSKRETAVRFEPFKITKDDKSQDLDEVLKAVQKKSDLDKRIVQVGGADIRLDEVKWDKSKKFWLLDFTSFRDGPGPGKASKVKPVKGHQYNQDENPTEETAALFYPKTSHLIVQYNHHGVKIGRILAYLSLFVKSKANAYDYEVLLDKNEVAKFKNREGTRKYVVKVAPEAVTVKDWDAGAPIGRTIHAGRAAGAQAVTISMSMGNNKGFLSKKAETELEKLEQMIEKGNAKGVEQARINLIQQNSNEVELVDLIEAKRSLIRKLPVDDDRRISRTERWNTLEAAFNSFSAYF